MYKQASSLLINCIGWNTYDITVIKILLLTKSYRLDKSFYRNQSKMTKRQWCISYRNPQHIILLILSHKANPRKPVLITSALYQQIYTSCFSLMLKGIIHKLPNHCKSCKPITSDHETTATMYIIEFNITRVYFNLSRTSSVHYI